MAPPNISFKDFQESIIDKYGRIKISNEYLFNNVLKKNNTLSSFAIDPTTKLFDKMKNFVENNTILLLQEQINTGMNI